MDLDQGIGQDQLSGRIDSYGDFQEPFADLLGPERLVRANIDTGNSRCIYCDDSHHVSWLIQGGEQPFLDLRQPERGKSLQERVGSDEMGTRLYLEEMPDGIQHLDLIDEP